MTFEFQIKNVFFQIICCFSCSLIKFEIKPYANIFVALYSSSENYRKQV